MRYPSKTIWHLVEQLHHLELKKPEEIARAIKILQAIEAAGEWSAILLLLSYLGSSSAAVRDAAAEAIDHLMDSVPKRLLFKLGELSRRELPPLNLFAFGSAKSFAFTPQLLKTQYRRNIIGLASCSSSGYVREEAVRLLAKSRDGKELPFLIMRLRDWVPAVRNIAREAVMERLSPNYFIYFVDNIVLLAELYKREENNYQTRSLDIVGHIYDELKKESNINLLLSGLTNRNYDVRRTCAAVLKSHEEAPTADIIVRLMQDKDVCNRKQIFEFAAGLDADDQKSLYKKLLNDTAPAIRKSALEKLCDLKPEQIKSIIEASLLDISAPVREHARWQMRQLEPAFDFAAFYKNILSSAPLTATEIGVIAGLGEVGTAEDAAIIAPLAANDKPAVRKAVIKSLAALNPRQYQNLFLEALTDPSMTVDRAAGKALARIVEYLDQDELQVILQNTNNAHTKKMILQLLNMTEKWDRLSHLLNAANNIDDPLLKTIVYQYLQSWAQQYGTTWSYTDPSPKQKQRLIAELSNNPLQNHSDHLQGESVRLLARCFQYLSKKS